LEVFRKIVVEKINKYILRSAT